MTKTFKSRDQVVVIRASHGLYNKSGSVVDSTSNGALVDIDGTNHYIEYVDLDHKPKSYKIYLVIPGTVSGRETIFWPKKVHKPIVGGLISLNHSDGSVSFLEITFIEFDDDWTPILRTQARTMLLQVQL